MFGSRKPPSGPSGSQSSASNPTPPGGTPSAPTRQPPAGFETVLGPHTSLRGELKSEANVRIDGTFDGAIEIDGNIMIGETAHISANIHAYNLSIAGSVRGDLTGQKIQVMRTGRVWGDLDAASIVTEDGAFIDGKITMNGHPAAKGFDTQDTRALPAPESTALHPAAEDALSGEPVEVELLDEHSTPREAPGT
ncbi:MAG: bactofilin family protein [Aggregatilineales bacterium]